MLRRRRRGSRSIDFGFDSFLDLVTNVVGIIIRLILVAWVGARAYHSLPEILKRSQPTTTPVADVQLDDPLQPEIERRRAELAQAEARLLEQLRQLDLSQEVRSKEEQALAAITAQRQQIEQALAGVATPRSDPRLLTSLDDLQTRQQRLLEQIGGLENQPPALKQLRYHVPVSQTVSIDEWHFECQHGKATFFPLGDLEAEMSRELPKKVKLLHTQWEVADVTAPVGAFRLRYTVVREKQRLDSFLGGGAPHPREGFGGYVEWEAEPVAVFRGETAEQALAEASAFRRLADRLDRELSAITFWVYPDSFGLYRQLRDYLVERGFTVAARPLPYGTPIAGSPRGSASRGQ